MSLFNISLKNQYNAFEQTSGLAAGAGTLFLLKKGWKLVTKKEPPENPASPSVLWREALLWGAVSGLAAGVAKVVFHRLSTSVWRKYRGATPS